MGGTDDVDLGATGIGRDELDGHADRLIAHALGEQVAHDLAERGAVAHHHRKRTVRDELDTDTKVMPALGLEHERDGTLEQQRFASEGDARVEFGDREHVVDRSEQPSCLLCDVLDQLSAQRFIDVV